MTSPPTSHASSSALPHADAHADAHATLQAWIAAEQALLARAQAGPGVATPAQIEGKSGMELMQGTLNGTLPSATMVHTVGALMVEAAEGRVVFQGTPGAGHLNPMGTVHGGWFATLLDSALGCAVHTLMPPGRGYTTAEFSINIVRALTPRVQRVRAIGQVVHCGRQLATAEGRLVGPDGTLYAHATTTCLVFDMKPQK